MNGRADDTVAAVERGLHERLVPIRVEASRVRRTLVGLRPFRPDGFRVEAERRRGKLLVHNYGHGGSGVTLSWGTAQQAANLVLADRPNSVVVLGCGVIGLTTARVLQAHGVRVSIHAASLPPDTTSDVPGAFWQPVGLGDPARMTPDFARQLAEALRSAHRAFSALSADARYGIRQLPLYYVDREPPRLSSFMAAAPELFDGPRLLPGEHPFGNRHAVLMQSMVVDTTRYLPALLHDFRAAGGVTVMHKLETLGEVAELDAQVIVNCTGLGARTLAGDATLTPLKGQLLLLEPQPDVRYIVVAAREGLYALPRRNGIVLGTSKQPGNYSLLPDERESHRILDGLQAICAGAN